MSSNKGLGLDNLLGGVFGNLEEVLAAAERVAGIKGDEKAKRDIAEIKKRLGQAEESGEGAKTADLGSLLERLLTLAEAGGAGGTEKVTEFEIGGRKGIISRGVRIGGLGGSDRQAPETFEVEKRPSTKRRALTKEKISTLTLDVFEEEDCIRVIGEMPGVKQEDIEYELKGRNLRVYTRAGKKYEGKAELPIALFQEIELKCQNAVMELKLIKKV